MPYYQTREWQLCIACNPIPEEGGSESGAHLKAEELLVLEVVRVEESDHQVDAHQETEVEVALPLLLTRADEVDHQVQNLQAGQGVTM
jgi:hypothetical protein